MGKPKTTQIEAILGEEFLEVLDKLGVKEGFEAGKYSCYVCGETVGINNVRILFPLSEDEVGFICNKPKCTVKYKSEQ